MEMNNNRYNIEELENLCDYAPCGMGIFISMKEPPIYLNNAYYELVGYSKEEYQREIYDQGYNLLLPEDKYITDENIEAFNSVPRNLKSEYRIKQKSGGIKWIRLSVVPFYNGNVIYGMCFFEDATIEKENLSMQHIIAENTQLSISVIRVKNDEASIVYANDKFFEYIGIPREEYILDPYKAINYNITKQDKQNIFNTYEKSISTGREQDVEYLYELKNGQKKYMKRRMSTIKSFDGSVLLLSVTSDITEQKMAEIKLKEEHDRLQMVLNEMHTAVFEWNLETGEFYTTGNYNDYAMSDVDNKLLLENKGPLDLIHPDDIDELIRYAKEAETDALKVEARLRLRLKKGGYRWVYIAAIRTLNEDGKRIKTTGVVSDINKEKESEQQLQNLIDNVPSGVSIYEIDNKKVISSYHNKDYYNLLGYTKEEFYAKTHGDVFKLIHPDDIKKTMGNIQKLFFDETTISTEIRNMCSNGKYSWFRINTRIIKKDQNKYTVYDSFTNIDDEIKARKKEKNDIMKYAIDVFNYLYNNNDIDKAVNIILKHLGEDIGASRAYIFEDDKNHNHCFNTFEWCDKGITSEIKNLQNVKYSDLGNDYRKLFNEDGVLECSDINTLPKPVYEILNIQGIYSILQCSIVQNGVFNGYIGFDECKQIRVWTQKEKDILRIVSKIIGVFLKKKKEEQNSKENSEKLTQIVRSIPGGVAIYRLFKDNTVKTDYVSSGLAKMCGYTQNEFLNVLKEDAMSNVVAIDRPIVFDAVNKAINLGENVNIVYRIYKKDKTTLRIRLNASLVKSNKLNNNETYKIYGVHTVISNYEQRLINKQIQNKVILKRLDIAYISWSAIEGSYYSEQFKRYAIAQIPITEILTSSEVAEYVHKEDEKILGHFLNEKNDCNGKTTAKLRMKMSDGTYRWTEILRFSEYDKDSRLISTLIIFMDVNEEWIAQNEYLKKALKEVETAKKSKELFFSQMSHDLRTPLNAVINLSLFAKEHLEDSAQLKEYIDSIYSSGQLLLGLVNDALDLEKAESNQMILHPTQYSYNEFKKNIITIIEPLCNEKNISLQLENNAEDYFLIVDKVRFEQIFINLLSNSVKFTHNGGKIELICKNKHISRDILDCDFIVKDNGIGMSKEYQEKMFIPFTQEYSNEISEATGTGLGLSIVYKLVNMMNGKISVNSQKGKGTEFIIHLSLPYLKMKKEYCYESKDKNYSILKNKNILLAEDHPINAVIATKILEKVCVNVKHCKDGKMAVEEFAISKINEYDLILMDIRMPVMDGIVATKEIRSMQRKDAKTVPIIALTANVFDEDMEEAKEAGINAHVAKPIEPEKLYEAIIRYV